MRLIPGVWPRDLLTAYMQAGMAFNYNALALLA